MSPDDFFKRQKEVMEEVANMSPERRAAFLAAAERHGRKVRSEILASAAVRERERANPGTEQGFGSAGAGAARRSAPDSSEQEQEEE